MMKKGTKIQEDRSITELPTPIIHDILSRLPIKTLLHSKLVSKDWLSLISEPHFLNLHRSKSPPSLLIIRDLRLIDLRIAASSHPLDNHIKFKPNINYPPLGRQIVNSCNGFLCFSNSDRINGRIYICNPILREYIALPYSPFDYDDDCVDTICAFGCSPVTNQYKVIRFILVLEDDSEETYCDEAEAEIYTLGGSWRKMGKLPYHLPNDSFNSLVNGALHWIDSEHPEYHIRCFDFGAEDLRVVAEPSGLSLNKMMSVGVLCDSLSICDCSKSLCVEVWMMKEYGVKESWRKELVIEKEVIGKIWKKGWYLNNCEPILILKSGEIFMLINDDTLVLYDPKLGSVKRINIYGIKSNHYGVVAHIASLVSVKEIAKGERNGLVY